jgi:hypothetical protein
VQVSFAVAAAFALDGAA